MHLIQYARQSLHRRRRSTHILYRSIRWMPIISFHFRYFPPSDCIFSFIQPKSLRLLKHCQQFHLMCFYQIDMEFRCCSHIALKRITIFFVSLCVLNTLKEIHFLKICDNFMEKKSFFPLFCIIIRNDMHDIWLFSERVFIDDVTHQSN